MTAIRPTLLLLHGVGDDGTCWAPFIAHVRACDLADLTVRTPDAPGHGGRRATPGHSLTWPDQLAEAIGHAVELADRRGGPIAVGGHSMGSATALGIAAARPDLVSGLWLEDPPLLTALTEADPEDGFPAHLDELRTWFSALQAIPFDDVVASARADHPNWEPSEYAPWARAKQSVDLGAFDEPLQWVISGWQERARAVRCPVVAAVGEVERGGLVGPRTESELRGLLGWSVHRLPTGHDVRRDAPEPTADLLAALIHSAAR